MAAVVEAQEGAAAVARPGFEEGRLGPGHVGGEAAEEDRAGAACALPDRGRSVVGEPAALAEVQNLRSIHGGPASPSRRRA